MESQNPYQPPRADVAAQSIGDTDQTNPFSPSGRFGRLSYIAWGFVFSVIHSVATGAFGGTDRLQQPGFGADVVAVLIISLAFLVCFSLFSIRRCHDVNNSGWLVLLGLIPLVNIVFLFYLFVKRGDQGSNKYAPPRVTRGWERVVGILGVAVMVVGLVGIIVALIEGDPTALG